MPFLDINVIEEYEVFKMKLLKEKALQYANNKSKWVNFIKQFLFRYFQKFKKFTDNNGDFLTTIIQKNELNLPQNLNEDEDFLINELLFLRTGIDLLDTDTETVQVDFKLFDNYEQIKTKSQNIKYVSALEKVQKKYKLKGLSNLEEYLQFIITFYKNVSLRIAFFESILKEKDFDFVQPENYKKYVMINT